MKPICRVAHAQILAGKCPWCDASFGGNAEFFDDSGTLWNIPAMMAALDESDEEVRDTTLSNLMRSRQPDDVILPLLSKALNCRLGHTSEMAGHELLRLGRDLSTADVERLESEVASSPYELALRILLLGYYILGQRESDAACRARHQHIFWLIQNVPECQVAGNPEASIDEMDQSVAYAQARQLWLDQVKSHPESTKVLGNAASFLLFG